MPPVDSDRQADARAEEKQPGVSVAESIGDLGSDETSTPSQLRADDAPRADERSISIEGAVVKSGGDQKIVGTEYNIHHHQSGLDAHTVRQSLTDDHFERFDRHVLEQLTDDLETDPDAISPLVDHIREHRVLVLVAPEPEMGKDCVALLVAGEVREVLGGVVRRAPRLDAEIKINLERLETRSGPIKGEVLCFEDAFAHNRALRAWVQRADSSRLQLLRRRCEEQDLFLILTAEADSIDATRAESLEALAALRRLPLPARDLLLARLRERSTRRPSPQARESDSSPQVEHLIEEHAELLATRLRTLPRVARFVEDHLEGILAGQQTVEEALDRMDDLGHWFHDQLREDLDAWCAALALTLAQTDPREESVPWFQFQALCTSIRAHFSSALEPKPQRRTLASVCLDDSILRKARIEAPRHHGLITGQSVQFVDHRYPERIWRLLLGTSRGAVTSLFDLLEQLAEEGDFYTRSAAARALGRIGELDPRYITLRYASTWAGSSNPRHHLALGSLAQGVSLSTDETYRELCRRHIENRAERGWVLAITYREVGQSDLPYAIDGLREMLAGALEEKVDLIDRFNRQLNREIASLKAQDRSPGASGAINALHRHVFWSVLDHIFSEREEEQLRAVEFSLVGLCFARDPNIVLRDLLAGTTDRSNLLAVIALLFLHQGGIADRLERNRISVGEELTLSRFLIHANEDPDSLRALCAVLVTIYDATDRFPHRIRKPMRTVCFELVTGWIREAGPIPEFTETIEALLAGLIRDGHDELKRSLLEWIRRDPEFIDPESDMAALAERARLAALPT